MKLDRLNEHILYATPGLGFKKKLPLFNRHPRSSLFLDIDGTIWPDLGPESLASGRVVQPEIRTCISQLRKRFDFLVLVTNQTYFSRRNSIDTTDLQNYFFKTQKLAKSLSVDLILSCHHHPEAQNDFLRKFCDFRKPNSGMFRLAIEMLNLDPHRSIMIGDRITDIIASAGANISNNFLISNPDAFKLNISKSPKAEVGVFFRVINSLKDIDPTIGKF